MKPLLTIVFLFFALSKIVGYDSKKEIEMSNNIAVEEKKVFKAPEFNVKDWIDAIRAGGVPACNIEEAFHEAVACHMATESYIQGRRIEWDPTKRVLV